MLSKRRTLTLFPAVLLALVAWWWLRNGSDVNPVGTTGTNAGEEERSNQTDSMADVFQSSGSANDVDRVVTRLFGQLEFMKQVHGELEGQKLISEMFEWMNTVPPETASQAIVEVLDSGEDALAFGRFAPSKDGFLKAYPSFRTALLDQLERLDPAEMVRVGISILSSSENPDEWALSLRALSKHSTTASDRAFLQDKVDELLHKDAWLNDPSYSYLHAFDAVVAEGMNASLARLAELVESSPNKAVTHAATVSLDRLFQEHSAMGAAYVSSQPELLSDATGFRASLMARIDPSDTGAVASVEAYLSDASFSSAEKQTFFQLFPNFNTTFSYNLITESAVPSRTHMRKVSIAAVDQLSLWASEGQYSEFEDDIRLAMNRLASAWKLEL